MNLNLLSSKPGLRMVGLLALSFAAAPALAQEALSVAPSGAVGVGVENPLRALHVKGASDSTGNANLTALRVENTSATTATRVMMQLVNSGPSQVFMKDEATGLNWTLTGGGAFSIDKAGNSGAEFLVTPNGGLQLRDGTAPVHFNMQPNGNLTITGTLSQSSDVNAKRDVVPVQAEQVLAKLASLPISTWEYKADEDGVTHLGPMAQDFHATFGLGGDPTKLSPGDLAGVAVAAIQAQQLEIKALRQELADLREQNARMATLSDRLAALESQAPQRLAMQ